MKTKTFLLICLFLGIGIAKLSAQTDAYRWYNVQGFFPVSCDGITWENLYYNCTLHYLVHHTDDGKWLWVKAKFNWTATSSSGEVFKGRELDPGIEVYDQDGNWLKETGTFHAILIGNQGSHYNITLSYNYFGEIDIDGNAIFHYELIEAKCH